MATVEELERAYHAKKAQRDNEYWYFSRRANHGPSQMCRLSAETEQARQRWLAAKRDSGDPKRR